MMKNVFGLIGYPLTHSFSKKYFTQKFEEENIPDCKYELFPLAKIEDIEDLIAAQPNLKGLNITIPYKEVVIPFLDELDEGAAAIGAVNTIKFVDGKRIGYNTDVYGFQGSLKALIDTKYTKNQPLKALILGTGGASKAIAYAFKQLDISYTYVSRTAKPQQFTYAELNKSILQTHQIIVNTTPLGTSPNTDACPNLPYQFLTKNHLLYDLVYNPAVTLFLQKGLDKGATIKNGLEMLHGQAEKSWAIWRDL